MIAADATGAGYTVLVPNVKDVDFVEYVGGDVLVGVRRSNNSKPRQVFRVDSTWTAPVAPLLSVNTANVFSRSVTGPNGLAAFVESTASKERLWRFDASTGVLTKFSDRAFFYGPTLSFASGGELGFTVGAGGAVSIFAAWSTTAPVVRLQLPIGPGFLLPRRVSAASTRPTRSTSGATSSRGRDRNSCTPRTRRLSAKRRAAHRPNMHGCNS